MKARFSAPAKLNLTLRVLGRRADGYHNLHTLIAFTDLADMLDIAPAPALSLTIDGPFAAHAPGDASNLALRAVRVMEQAAGREANMHIRLTKNLPAGAGMGGGSADAAAAMHAVNAMWARPFTEAQLAAMGLQLGAELPVCLAGRAQRVTGIGETLEAVHLPLMHAVVAWPGVTLATADVFRAYAGPYSLPPADDLNMATWNNDLTQAAVSLAPAIGDGLSALREAGATFVQMTGSGSSVFGLFADDDAAKKAAAKLAAAHSSWWVRDCRIISS